MHEETDGAAADAEYFPTGQAVHAVFPVPFAKVP